MNDYLKKVNVSEGQKGDWAVHRFNISEPGASVYNLRLQLQSMFYDEQAGSAVIDRQVIPGTYTALIYLPEMQTVMSDTPAEMDEHREFVNQAKGNVLITGLGLGMCVEACLRKTEVTSVTVIEKSSDVIDLVGHGLLSSDLNQDNLTILQGNAFTFNGLYNSDPIFDTIWHDIWHEISGTMIPEADQLFQTYQPILRPGGWQSAWYYEEATIIDQEHKQTEIDYENIRDAILEYSDGQIDLLTPQGKILALAAMDMI